ncbi:hypothetical protein Ddep01_03091 [Deinococcus depolymerans]
MLPDMTGTHTPRAPRLTAAVLLTVAGLTGTAGSQPARPAAQAAALLTVEFPLRAFLINAAAPNRLTLTTPWEEVSAAPQGRPHPARRGYYAQVAPLLLPLRVPGGTPAGRYAAQLRALLFSCGVALQTCAARTVTLPVTLDVQTGGRVWAAPLRITDAGLRGGSLRP